MRGFYTFLLAELRFYFRDMTNAFFAFVVPGAMYVFFGFMHGDASYGEEGLSYFETYTPAMIGTVIFITAMFSIGIQYVAQREGGVFKRFLATPLSSTAIILSTLIRGTIMTTLGIVLMMGLGYVIFDRQPTAYLVQFYLAFLLSTMSFFAFGFMMSCFFNRMQTALGFCFVIFYPMLFLSGATFPIESLPETMQSLSKYVPLTYVIDIMQLGWSGNLFSQAATQSALFLVAMGLVCTAIASKYFRWVD